jgi:hypothetical protein
MDTRRIHTRAIPTRVMAATTATIPMLTPIRTSDGDGAVTGAVDIFRGMAMEDSAMGIGAATGIAVDTDIEAAMVTAEVMDSAEDSGRPVTHMEDT